MLLVIASEDLVQLQSNYLKPNRKEVNYLNILFLDLSTKSTGYCVSNSEGEMLGYGLLTATSDNNLNRVKKIQDQVIEVIKKYNIEKIVAEDVHPETYGYSDTSRLLMWLQGAVMLGAHEVNSSFTSKTLELMQASEWRKKLGIKTGRSIKREALKQSDINFVQQKYNITANDDVCDAICLYSAYFAPNIQKSAKEFNWE